MTTPQKKKTARREAQVLEADSARSKQGKVRAVKARPEIVSKDDSPRSSKPEHIPEKCNTRRGALNPGVPGANVSTRVLILNASNRG